MSHATTVEFSQQQYDDLAAKAKAVGLTIPAYIEFLDRCRSENHDAHFIDAARYVFKNYPATLKSLAQ